MHSPESAFNVPTFMCIRSICIWLHSTWHTAFVRIHTHLFFHAFLYRHLQVADCDVSPAAGTDAEISHEPDVCRPEDEGFGGDGEISGPRARLDRLVPS